MAYAEHWQALATRIRGLRSAGELYGLFQSYHREDSYGVGEELSRAGVVLFRQEQERDLVRREANVANDAPLALPFKPVRDPAVVARVVDERRQLPQRVVAIDTAGTRGADLRLDQLRLCAVLVEVPQGRAAP